MASEALFDVSKEPAKLRDKYGRTQFGEQALIARWKSGFSKTSGGRKKESSDEGAEAWKRVDQFELFADYLPAAPAPVVTAVAPSGETTTVEPHAPARDDWPKAKDEGDDDTEGEDEEEFTEEAAPEDTDTEEEQSV